MASSGMLRRMALVKTDVSEELSASFIRVTKATRRNIPEDAILHSHRRENLKSYNSGLVCFPVYPRASPCLYHKLISFCRDQLSSGSEVQPQPKDQGCELTDVLASVTKILLTRRYIRGSSCKCRSYRLTTR
jgi:hypothetical protein